MPNAAGVLAELQLAKVAVAEGDVLCQGPRPLSGGKGRGGGGGKPQRG